MRAAIKRFDDRLANGEAKVATVVLLVMIAAAFMQALLEVLAKRMGVDAAQSALESLGNIDHFLQTATLWLAFLGASLATHANKHIAIDVLDRVLPKNAQRPVKVATFLVSGIVSLLLTWIFIEVIIKEGSILPADLATFSDGKEIHVCDAPAAILADNELSKPTFFCAVRGVFESIGMPLQAPRPAFQLVVPFLFGIIGLRFVLRSVRIALGEDPTGEVVPPIAAPTTPVSTDSAAAGSSDEEASP